MAIAAAGALLEMCVLAALSQRDAYGYVLTQALKQSLGVSESTVYPVVRRLQAARCLEMYDVARDGRNRRYYRITDSGRQSLAALQEDWRGFKDRVDAVLGDVEQALGNGGGDV
jgi:PadR family transcriptional regulator PadR